MRVLPVGDHAFLVEDPSGGPAAWSRGFRARVADRGVEVIDVVPAASTVLVRCTSAAACRALVSLAADVAPLPTAGERAVAVIPVRYDGPDLLAVAEAAGLTPTEVVAAHTSATYEVAFCGFAPGFGYLTGLPERLHLPRRATPRTRVPAGSVAIAAGYAAVYPGASPGGWHLLGTTDIVLFDPSRTPPALLAPGTVVRFEER